MCLYCRFELSCVDHNQCLHAPVLMKELIEKTTTIAGLKVFAFIFNKVYETGRKVVEGFKESMRIVFDKHLRQWNYVAMPEAAIL